MRKAQPLRDGLFRVTIDGPTLLASRCAGCGQVSFPPTEICFACRGEQLATIELGDQGELLCATTVHVGSQNFLPGYTVGFVLLPQDVRIFAPLRPIEGKTLKAGRRLQLEVAPLWQTGDEDVLGYRFVPA